jgi:hypothetical protein
MFSTYCVLGGITPTSSIQQGETKHFVLHISPRRHHHHHLLLSNKPRRSILFITFISPRRHHHHHPQARILPAAVVSLYYFLLLQSYHDRLNEDWTMAISQQERYLALDYCSEDGLLLYVVHCLTRCSCSYHAYLFLAKFTS